MEFSQEMAISHGILFSQFYISRLKISSWALEFSVNFIRACNILMWIMQELEKVQLAESTGLDQRQINNWFINQRKRHWKPADNVQFTVMDKLYAPFYVNE